LENIFCKEEGQQFLCRKAEEDATFCLKKDGTFFALFCLTNSALEEKYSSGQYLYEKGSSKGL
jgi:hypothetical protein